VESLADEVTSDGRTENISVGGLLFVSGETFQVGTEVVVKLVLPSGHGVIAQGKVVHSKPGVRMGIQFLHLTDEDQKAIGNYVQEIQPYTRRSSRLAKKLTVVLRWRDGNGNPREELAETVTLSRDGGLLVSPTAFKPGENAALWWPAQKKNAQIRIVYRQLGGTENLAKLGFTFVDTENFWGIEFPY
jgi:hypothetical protein